MEKRTMFTRRETLHFLAGSALLSFASLHSASGQAADASAKQPVPSFPSLKDAVFLSGELAVLDPINRRAGLRIDCSPRESRRESNGPLHYFAMLPTGEIWFHGAPATFQDIPPGTHVQGYFLAAPSPPDTLIAPPPTEFADLIPKENHALLLEDDVSFARRIKFQWRVLSVSKDTSKLRVEPVGTTSPDGPSGPLTLDFDLATRVWEKGALVSMDRVKVGGIVSINFARGINWTDREFGTEDIWLDEESLTQAAEIQERRNVRYHRVRWLPGIVEAVEPFDYGGGQVTIALVGGVARQLLDDLRKDQNERIAVASAEPTLRTWRHRGDRVFGKLRRWEDSNPFPGFSGVRLHLRFTELLDHFRPGNAVRVKAESWLFISNTPEERIKSLEDRAESRTLRLPGQVVDAPSTPSLGAQKP
jgi:hypothetical protein